MKNESKNNLIRKATISLNTCSVGSLASFEKEFGYLFGYGMQYEELTEEQKKFRKKWYKVRDEILDRAENSKRLLLREINNTKIIDDLRYETIIRPKERKNG